jgi:hypothetical protein
MFSLIPFKEKIAMQDLDKLPSQEKEILIFITDDKKFTNDKFTPTAFYENPCNSLF